MKMKKIIFVIIIIFIIGCSEPIEKTAKEKAQDTLLYELKHCDTKFGTDSESRRQMNKEYCFAILDVVKTKIDENWFEGDQIVKTVDYMKEIDTSWDVTTEYSGDDVKTAIDEVNSIIGDI